MYYCITADQTLSLHFLVVGLFLWMYLYDTLNQGSKGKINSFLPTKSSFSNISNAKKYVVFSIEMTQQLVWKEKIHGDIRSSRCTSGVVDTDGKWEKSSIWKVLIILFGHLWVVESRYRYNFSFKFTLMCMQPDVVPFICHRCCWHRRQICCRYCWHRWQICQWWCTLTCEYLRKFPI